MPEEEGKEIMNHTVGVQGIPIYMGNETQCNKYNFSNLVIYSLYYLGFL